jgi:deoxyribodipyrimidine photo-lyase
MKINLFWFRRDLRLEDNAALDSALTSGLPVLPVFIFDTNITEELPDSDPRITFIYTSLSSINKTFKKNGSSICILKGDPVKIWEKLIVSFDINSVYINKDYEPYSLKRDTLVESLLKEWNIPLKKFKDHVIFEEKEILKTDSSPYTVFTPYRNKWLTLFQKSDKSGIKSPSILKNNFLQCSYKFPSIEDLGFHKSSIIVKPYDLSGIDHYEEFRDSPSADRTSYLSPHLRFGTISIRSIVYIASEKNQIFLNELIWREFFMQILFNFPNVVTENFRPKFNNIRWINNEDEFIKWSKGETGYPLVDAGMRQLNKTGYMHNRIRMVSAGFLCKNLLIDWRWGEAYFAGKLLDYELSSNNGNWQWAAGTGCDAVPYFRIFNPYTQQRKFDPDGEYIKRWVDDINKSSYPPPVVDHNFARKRAITAYKTALAG